MLIMAIVQTHKSTLVILAVGRVPPSAWMTSQSIVIARSPNLSKSNPERKCNEQ